MISRRTVLAAGAFVGALGLSAAQAVEHAAYSKSAFDAALSAGKPILVEVHASWCPTCKAQAPVIMKLLTDPRFAKTTVFRVDFDAQKDALRRFRAQKQSTLIVFKGGKETGRSVGESDPLSIEDLLEKTL